MVYNKVLIIRADRIGDVLLSTPAIEAVRRANPGAYIAFMTRPYTKDILVGNPYLDEVIVYDKDAAHHSVFSTILFGLALRRYRFDVALILHSTNRVNWLAYLAGIPRRMGYDRKCGWLLTDKLPYAKHEGLKHEMEYTLDIVRLAGIRCNDKEFKPYMPISQDAKAAAVNFLKENAVNEKDVLVGINPGAGCPSRRWLPERYARVADEIINQTSYKIIILGIGEDLKFANLVKDNMKHNAIILKNSTVPQTAALLKICKFFISTDTGPCHIASAVGTPCITIFGRKQPGLNPLRWRPLGENVVVLHKDVGCMECLAHNCDKRFACLEAITAEEVLHAAKKFY